MSRYDRSTHRNDKAEKNRITDNRPAQFRDDDDEQAAISHNRFKRPFWQRVQNPASILTLMSVGVAFGMVGITALKACDKTPEPVVVQSSCVQCHGHRAALIQYFRQNGSKSPEEMANAVLDTKFPRLLAAISKVESGGNPHLRNTGYRKKHHGAFQVNPKYWGEVSFNPAEQALQAERILTELTDTMPVKQALNFYGGDVSRKKYSNAILAEMVKVP